MDPMTIIVIVIMAIFVAGGIYLNIVASKTGDKKNNK
ncbi:hypothetical protein CLORY_28860 [Clostridium oryzae]|uniref:Uncharacterized protein n=1 Tax=Clostridium oryzae TaxID=1450648 RepID=A0A1V4IJX1_9CLOT|nr:hypothetical protein CLORY_28860 [Clostridium oryzae]